MNNGCGIKATEDDLSKVESFFNSIRERIRSAETLGLLVLTDKGKEFLDDDGKFYEPEGTSWILRPLYADPSDQYWKLMHDKCNPISHAKSLEPTVIEKALTEIKERMQEKQQNR